MDECNVNLKQYESAENKYSLHGNTNRVTDGMDQWKED